MAERRYLDAIAAYRAAEENVAIGSARRIYELARAYDLDGQADSALAAYERAVNLPRKTRLFGDYDRLGPAYKRLGELYEARGDRERAVEYYSEFVDLWSDADDELQPLVRDVRQRLAELVGVAIGLPGAIPSERDQLAVSGVDAAEGVGAERFPTTLHAISSPSNVSRERQGRGPPLLKEYPPPRVG